jgi:GTP cyclohydrolase I
MIAPQVTTKTQTELKLHDTQATVDRRGVQIDRVGVKGVQFPIVYQLKNGKLQHTIGSFNLYVELPSEQRGTHMSRFMEALHESQVVISPQHIGDLCRSIRDRLHAPVAYVEVECPLFIEKPAPITGIVGLVDYKVKLSASSRDTEDMTIGVRVPAKSLCPCSKEISDYGAHNQRSEIEVHVKTQGVVHVEELIEYAEGSASSPIYSLLKRPDERFVTQAAYDNPKFVEDIVRDFCLALDADERISWYKVSTENFESIHNHQAYAEVERQKS